MKRILSLCLAVIALIALLPTPHAQAKTLTLAELKAKFPNGAYWNHVAGSGHNYVNYNDVGSCNNPDGYTWTPCYTHTGNAPAGKYDCNSFNGGMQCSGFARKLAYDAYGSYATNWTNYTGSNAANYVQNSLKPGDVLHYSDSTTDPEFGHWVFVIGVNGNAITVGECNVNGARCQIRWGNVIYKDRITKIRVCVAPWALATTVTDPYPVGASVINISTDTAKLSVTWKNPSGIQLLKGGFVLKNSAGTVLKSVTENVPASYQTALDLPCGYEMKTEYQYPLQPNTTYQYTMFVIDSNNKQYDVSGSFTTAAEPVKITNQPTSKSAADGASVSTKVVASGKGLKYQWYYKSATSSSFVKSSQTTATYSTTMNSTRNGYKVYCVITDAMGNSVTSNTVTLTMRNPLKITTQPSNKTAVNGATVSTKVVASGDGLKYQWYFKAAGASSFSKSSATTATYSTTMNAKRNGYKVYCVITDKYGNSVKSNTVTLTMGNPLKITTQPTSKSAANGATVSTKVVASGDGLKYQWYYKSATSSTFVKSSTTTATYSTTMNAKRNGYKVYCVVTDKYGNSVKTNTVTLTMAKALKITTQPTSKSAADGATVSTKVVASGDGLKYQWYFKAAGASSYTKSSTTTATYSTTMNAARDGYKVYCVVTDKYGNSVKSNTVTLSMK